MAYIILYKTDNIRSYKNVQLQSCTEIISPYCTNGVDDMLAPAEWNLEKEVARCANTYKVTPRPQWMRKQFGGKNLRYTSNIIFTLVPR